MVILAEAAWRQSTRGWCKAAGSCSLQQHCRHSQRACKGSVTGLLHHRPVVKGRWMQRKEANNETLHAVTKLATGGTEKCFENTVTTASQLLETPLFTFYRMRNQGGKIKTGFPKEPPGVMSWHVLISQFPLLFWRRCTIHLVGNSSSAQQQNPSEDSHVPPYI